MKHRIEFIGLPGSGKTSLYNSAYNYLKGKNADVLNLEQAVNQCELLALNTGVSKVKSFKKVAFILGHAFFGPVFPYTQNRIKSFLKVALENPDFISTVFSTIGKNDTSFDVKLRICNWFFKEWSAYQLINEHLKNDEILILDEGYCHRSASLIACDSRLYSDELLNSYLSVRTFLPNHLVVVKRDRGLCLKALDARGLPRDFASLNSQELEHRFNVLQRWLDNTVEKATIAGVNITEIQNAGDIESAKQQLNNSLRSILDS